jgi:hypothetical protein
METVESVISTSPRPEKKSFWRKGIFIPILSFIFGGVVVLSGLKIFFLMDFVSVTLPSPTPPLQIGETPEPTTPESPKIAIGQFQLIPKTDVTPKIFSVKKVASQETDIQPPANEIKTYDPETEQTFSIPIQTRCCGGALYTGGDGPLLSPTYQRIAYIDKEEKNIWVIDNEGSNKIRISTQGVAESELFWGTELSLSGWSSSDKWLVYYVNIVDEGMGINPKDKLQPQVIEGFYVANLEEGKIYFLPGLPNFVDFLPKSDLIVFIDERQEERQRILYTYDLITGRIERLTKEAIGGTFSGQFSFTNTKFAYVVAESEPSSSELIYAPLANASQDRQKLAAGQFTEVQFPKISPNGRFIAYEKRNLACSGGDCYFARLVVYDLEINQEKTLGQIKDVLYWFDDNRLVAMGGFYGGPWSLQITDINTGSVKTVSEEEALRHF